ncbi:hypothetical protein KIW84_065181 [Lathyrus oleraceus]|uniref:DUF7745 domain-containing protein n=1 Tax=Pisum sativum TaxID=3888 RepID=A0A9D4WER0_PEA|nr:hypothetical protein KIW84_065181 [Pisum sativum]
MEVTLGIPAGNLLLPYKVYRDIQGLKRSYLDRVSQGLVDTKRWESSANILALIVFRGCINYNPVIAIRQLGYPIWEKLKDDNIKEFILHNGSTTHRRFLRRIIQSWEKVHTKENELKRKSTTTKESYTQWVKEKAQLVKLHFVIDPRNCLEIPNPIHVSIEETDHLKETITHLKQEKESLEHNLYNASYKKNQLKSNLGQKAKQHCLNRKLRDARIEGKKWKIAWEIAKWEQEEMNDALESQIPILERPLAESQASTAREHQLRAKAEEILPRD